VKLLRHKYRSRIFMPLHFFIKTFRWYFIATRRHKEPAFSSNKLPVQRSAQSMFLLCYTICCCFLATSPFYHKLFPLEVQSTGKHYEHLQRSVNMAVPWLRRLVAGLTQRRSGFDHGSVHVGFVDKVALGQVFLPRVLRFSPLNFIPPVLHYTEKKKNTVYYIYSAFLIIN
jgi:hypothetical protein